MTYYCHPDFKNRNNIDNKKTFKSTDNGNNKKNNEQLKLPKLINNNNPDSKKKKDYHQKNSSCIKNNMNVNGKINFENKEKDNIYNISTIKNGNINSNNSPIKKEESNVKIKQRNVSQFSKNPSIYNLPKIEKKEKYINGTIGLINIGNSCYFNSAIQNLKNVYPLTLYLLKNYLKFDKNGFAFKYCELIANLINQDTYQYFEPRDFLLKLCDIAPLFRFGQQNDSNFCILYVLNLLEKETRTYINEKPFKKIEIINNEFCEKEKKKFSLLMKKFYEKRNSYIIDIFYGFQEDIYKCNSCDYVNYNFQGFSVLNIPIINKNKSPIHSLTEAIDYYQEEQKHYNEEGFSCPSCDKNVISTQSLIISFPNFFIINFKRIGEDSFYNHNVSIPMEFERKNLVNGDDNEYELIGFIKHYGNENSGHNIVICKNFFDSLWYVFNDSRVKHLNNSEHIKEKEIDISNGFLFFYKKKNYVITEEEKNKIITISKELRK